MGTYGSSLFLRGQPLITSSLQRGGGGCEMMMVDDGRGGGGCSMMMSSLFFLKKMSKMGNLRDFFKEEK